MYFALQEKFVERMMDRQMKIISTRRKHLSPKHAVLLYHQLYLLQNIMDYSENMAASIPRSYAEEFRSLPLMLINNYNLGKP